MSDNKPLSVDDAAWREWFEACSIGNCRNPGTVEQLVAFGRSRLREALHTYSPETAQLYCDSQSRNPRCAWLTIEQYLYGGTEEKQGRAGKAYKDRLIERAEDRAHFEALLSLKIRREIARRILSEEGFDISQKTDAETGRRRFVVTRKAQFDEEFDDGQAELDGIYVEPADEAEEEAVRQAAECQADAVWKTLSEPARAVQRLLLVCHMMGVFDLQALLASGLIRCKQSQLYNERKKLFVLLETLDWGRDCTTPSGRAYMTRKLLPELKTYCVRWLAAVENAPERHFIETAGREVRQ